MKNIEWIFDGIGSTTVSFVLGLIFGSVGGIKIYKTIRQKQSAKNNACQTQVGSVFGGENSKHGAEYKTTATQVQKSRDNAKQIQIGELKNE